MKGTERNRNEFYWDDVEVAEELPILSKKVTPTTIVAGAIATRDFAPLHHDHAWALREGARDIFMNIHTTNGFMQTFLDQYTGYRGELKRMETRLAASCYPGDTMVWTGRVTKKYVEGGQHLIDVECVAKVQAGDHCLGKATIILPVRNG